MDIKLDKTGSLELFEKNLKSLAAHKDVQGILILACDKNGFKPENVDKILKEITVPVFGGIFPGLISGKEKLDKGTILVGLSTKPDVHIIPRLSNNSIDYEDNIEASIPEIGETKTMFIFVDGLAKRISDLIAAIFNLFGLGFNYIGGGAGSLSFEQKPCLFTNEGMIDDSAILVPLNIETGVGVAHGWNDISGPYKVTEAHNNVIKSLDWKPAFQVYKDVVENHSGQKFTKDNFFDIAKKYPFGISKFEAEKVVRDPFKESNDGSITCVGEVPNGVFLHILNGNPKTLIEAATRAYSLSKKDFKGDPEKKSILFIDCISRVLFLEDEFSEEINAVYQEKIPLIGALTIGEIANNKKDYLEFYNKTSVVCLLED